MGTQNYFSYLLNPLALLRTKKVLQVNPTAASSRTEPYEVKLVVRDYTAAYHTAAELKNIEDSFPYIYSDSVSWINVDGLRKANVEAICSHYGIHNLLIEDILSFGQRPKMDEMEGLEEDIVRQPNTRSLAKINMLRKEMIILKRSVAP